MDNFLDDSLYLGVELGLLLGITEKTVVKPPQVGICWDISPAIIVKYPT